MKNIVIYCFILCSLFDCKGQDYKHLYNNKPYHFSPIYQRDSLFLYYTVKEYTKRYEKKHLQDGLVQWYDTTDVVVDTIMYSPDSLKLFAFTLVKRHNQMDRELKEYLKPDFDYDLENRDLIAYRKNKTSIWKVYRFFGTQTSFTLSHKKDMRFALRLLYFERFKNPDFNSHRKKYLYNVNEKGFWTGPIWEKNQEGEYLFAEGRMGNEDYIYPESLLKRFMGN
jgi:hypothetical protein